MITVESKNAYFVVSPTDLGERYSFSPDKTADLQFARAKSLCDTVSGCLMLMNLENTLPEGVGKMYVYGIYEVNLSRQYISCHDLISNGKDIAEVTGEIQVPYAVDMDRICSITVDSGKYSDLEYNPIYTETDGPIHCRLYYYEVE